MTSTPAEITIRPVQPADARAFLQLCHHLDRETQFMMLEPDERQTTVEQQAEQLRQIESRDNQQIWIASAQGQMVGYLAAHGGQFRRNRHRAYLVIGVRQNHSGQGIGSALFSAMETWARANGIHRLELTVMAHNERALGLYKKLGFAVEGTRHDSLCVDGVYLDEYHMAKLLA